MGLDQMHSGHCSGVISVKGPALLRMVDGGRLLLYHQDLEQRGQFFSQLLGGGDRSAVLFSTYAIKYAVIRE
jgi:hypothetical protein